jgi:DNA-binding GntR family transcriptional regulator
MEARKNIHQITIQDMAPHVHHFSAGENKVDKIAKWLINWITLSLECRKIKPGDLMPTKADLACHIGVSQGTIQNAFRIVEDFGYLESKQRLGTYIKDFQKDSTIEKLTSKRELAIEIIKKYLIENNYQIGHKLPSIRKLSKAVNISSATIRTALINLTSIGIIDKQENSYIISETNFSIKSLEAKTLVEKIANKINEEIIKKIEPGEKIPSNSNLAKKFNVSIKTIHDAIRYLTKKGVLYTKRGQYGTIVSVQNSKPDLYDYQKFEQKIKTLINLNYKIGSKLPSIKFLAKEYNTSEKTIKKALDNLAEDGYLTFTRGRYGGTFVTDIPQASNEAYKWLALNSEYLIN